MPTYRIRIDQEVDADTPEEAANEFRGWLGKQDLDNLYSPYVEVMEMKEQVLPGMGGLTAEVEVSTPMDLAVFEWWEDSQCLHMKPCVGLFKESPVEPEDDEEPGDGSGWYSRLSAPGYLDCTEWSGPYPTRYVAMESLFNMFGE